MTKKEREAAALAPVAQECLRELGGRADIQAIAKHVSARLGAEQYAELTWTGFVALVRNALRSLDDGGLPSALSLNGEYVQTVLMTVDEYRCAVRQYMQRSRANRVMAEKYVHECQDRYGVDISDELAATA